MIPAAQATEPGARAERQEASSPSADADLARKRKWFRAWEQNKQDELNEGREARKYYHDKQWTEAEKRKLAGRGQQATVRNRIKRKIEAVQTLDDLGEVWRAENPVIKEVGAVSKPMMAELVAAKNARRDALTPKPADDLGGDEIPY